MAEYNSARGVRQARAIQSAARAFIHAHWSEFLDLMDSDSVSADAEFLLLGQAVEKRFGPPEGAIPSAQFLRMPVAERRRQKLDHDP